MDTLIFLSRGSVGVINIEDVQPGMVLAADLRTTQGRLLLPLGSPITSEHLRIARIWGITEADVQGVSEADAERDALSRLDPEVRKLLDALSGWRFSCCDLSLAPVRQLMRLFMQRAARGATRGKAADLVARYRGPRIPPDVLKAPLPAEKPTCADILKKELGLASLPTIFNEIVEAVKSPKSSAAHIAEVIGKDPSIASRLLRLVNSAFYGFQSQIDTLSRAVAIVGTIQITNLAMGIAVTTSFKGIPEEHLDLRAFWEHSIAVGVMARLLASHARVTGEERLFVAGLLHDIGRLVMVRNCPDRAADAVRRAMASGKPMDDVERVVWGFSHARLGSLLMHEWKLPEGLRKAVDMYHVPFKADAEVEAALIHVADVTAHALGFGHSGSRLVPPLFAEAWKRIGLPISILPTLAAQTENQMRDLMRVFLEDHAAVA